MVQSPVNRTSIPPVDLTRAGLVTGQNSERFKQERPRSLPRISMGHFRTGDVLLVPVRLGRSIVPKVRPVVVVGAGENGVLFVCPVSSRPPSDTPSIPLRLDDFAEGGLDLFEESYILSTHICRVTVSEVIGRKGRLRPGIVDGILPG